MKRPALDHGLGLLNAIASIVKGAGWKRLGHERPEEAFCNNVKQFSESVYLR
jgi:hypothetical protein